MTQAVPWRLGAPSFVYPAGWLENVERLGPLVDDIEILFFEAKGPQNFPSDRELRGLVAAKAAYGLTYTLHTPLSASLASADETRRLTGVQEVLHALQVAAPLHPERVVVHVYLGDCEGDAQPPDLDAWRKRASLSLQALLDSRLVSAQRLCVECLDYDFALIAPVIEALDLRVALDVGHLMRDGRDVMQALERYGPRVRAIQWHGTTPEGRDHRGLDHLSEDHGKAFVQALLKLRFGEVLTLEVFRPDDWARSLDLLHAWTQQPLA